MAEWPGRAVAGMPCFTSSLAIWLARLAISSWVMLIICQTGMVDSASLRR